MVRRGHAESGVDLTYIKASGESNGEAGDQYAGLDRFGRIVDQRWRTSSVEKDRYQYRYDRDGNRLYRENMLSTTLSEIYWYDGINQLKQYARGQMAGPPNEWTISASRWQTWDYDALGNMEAVNTDGTNQTRTHNKQNEITAVSGATTPVFDANGNMTTDETGKQYVYDAWNRLVTVKNSGGTTIASYAYDALTRRVSETASSVTTDLYYSAGWQVLEERVGGAATKSYVWSPVYVDAMVARDRDTDANGSLDERLYVTHDANFNVTGLVTTGGTVAERYTYDPYGAAQARDGSWTVTTTAYVWQYLHQGGRLSGESGLYAFRYRDYSPTLGRWVTMDPIGANINLYVLSINNVVNNVDPYGLWEKLTKRMWEKIMKDNGIIGANATGGKLHNDLGDTFEVVVFRGIFGKDRLNKSAKFTSNKNIAVYPDFVAASSALSITYIPGVRIPIIEYLRGDNLVFFDAKMGTTPIKLSDQQIEGFIDILSENKEKLKGGYSIKRKISPVLIFISNSDLQIQSSVVMYGTQNGVLVGQSVAEWECRNGDYWLRLGNVDFKNSAQIEARKKSPLSKGVSYTSVPYINPDKEFKIPKKPR